MPALLVTTACTLSDPPDTKQSGGPAQGGADAVAGGTNASGGTRTQESSAGSGMGESSDGGAADTSGSSSGASNADGIDPGSPVAGSSAVGGNGNAAGTSTGGSAGMGGTTSCTSCGGSCVDLTTTEQHCGACGYACVNGRECVDGRCTPEWQPIATSGAPAARSSHAAAFVSGKYVVLGGCLTWDGPALDTTGAYDPASDRWSTLAPLKTARGLHQVVSTGTELYTFGGLNLCTTNGGVVGPGLERFVPNAGQGTWSTISAAGEPELRSNFNMVWTGAAVMIYGGQLLLPTSATGGLFDPATSRWTDASCALTSCDRSVGAFFKDGNVIRFMGGQYNVDYPDWTGNVALETTGLSYNPSTNAWSTWPHPPGTPSLISTSPWADDGRRIYFPTGGSVGIYDRKTGWLPRDSAPMPAGLCASGATYAWSGTEVIGWGGNCSQATQVGGRYQPPAPP